MRLFIAIEIPRGVREQVAALQQQLNHPFNKIRWVQSESIHITLKFLGETKPELIPELKQAIKGALPFVPFKMSLQQLGVFPDLHFPQVVWCGIHEGGGLLKNLVERIESIAESLGFEEEKRSFHPHLTLGRVKFLKEKNWFIQKITGTRFATEEFEVDHFNLFQSELGEAGAKYSILETYPPI